MQGSEPLQRSRILICAPFGRDAALIQNEILAAGLATTVCDSIEDLSAQIEQGAGAALIADESLRETSVKTLAAALANQQPWSDFPLIIMTSGGDTTRDSRYRLRLLEPLGNVTLLERPLRIETLISSLRAALRARAHQYQLADLLQERAASERELQTRNEQLTIANRELEEFAYVSSHDLQEPLRMINIYTQLLIRQINPEDEKLRQFARFIYGAVTRMENLLRDLLNFSRTIHPDGLCIGTADLSVSVSKALATLSGRIQENHATVKVDRLPTVSGDEDQLAQVFQNLLSNALKYRKPTIVPEIKISAELQGENWVISVQDNGIGFDPVHAERIFGLFKRLHKDAYPGTGLGLAICQRVIERCGGRIWAESSPDKGATFRFSLSVVPAETTPPQPERRLVAQ